MINNIRMAGVIMIVLFGLSNSAMADEQPDTENKKTTIFGIESEAKYPTGYDRSATNGDIYHNPKVFLVQAA